MFKTRTQFLFAWLLIFLFAQSGIAPGYCKSRRLEVAVLKDAGVGGSYDALAEVLRRYEDTIHTTVLKADDVQDGALKNFDVFIVPGGSARKEAHSLDEHGRAEIIRYVKNGGSYIGICAGCYLATNGPKYLGLLPVGVRDKKHWFRGKALLPIEFTKFGGEVFGVSAGEAKIEYHNGPILDCRKAFADPQLSKEFVPLAYFRGEIVAPGGEVGVMNGAPAMVLAQYGKGLVMGLSPHAERTPALNKILPSAIRWLCEHEPANEMGQRYR